MSKKPRKEISTIHLVVQSTPLAINPDQHRMIVFATANPQAADKEKRRRLKLNSLALSKTVTVCEVRLKTPLRTKTTVLRLCSRYIRLEQVRYHATSVYCLRIKNLGGHGQIYNDTFDFHILYGLSLRKIKKIAQKQAEEKAQKTARQERAKLHGKVKIAFLW